MSFPQITEPPWFASRSPQAVAYRPRVSSVAKRGLSPDFLSALKQGVLSPLLERVRGDRALCLEIREDYINVYYRGGNLLRVSRLGSRYDAHFDANYLGGPAPASLPGSSLTSPADVAAWLNALPGLKDAMDLFFGRHPKEEREIQQLILRDNNFGSLARSTDYYICDIEYANSHGRFDVIGVHWPSTPVTRKRDAGHRLVLGEVKQGDGALDGACGLHSHIIDVNSHLADPSNLDAIKTEMVTVFNQKRSLGLLDCGKDLVAFSDERPLLVLMLVNHDPEKSRLRELLRTLPESPHAELRIATSSLLGYGLYDPGVMTIDDALATFGDRI